MSVNIEIHPFYHEKSDLLQTFCYRNEGIILVETTFVGVVTLTVVTPLAPSKSRRYIQFTV